MEIKLFITGSCPSKKNARINTRSGRSFPSKAYSKWHEAAMLEIMVQKPPLGITRCEAHLIFHMPDKRRTDLDNKLSSVLDLLVDAGVIVDDSWQIVTPITLHGFYDKENSGVEVILKYDIDKYGKNT